jgi:hypothetical protein
LRQEYSEKNNCISSAITTNENPAEANCELVCRGAERCHEACLMVVSAAGRFTAHTEAKTPSSPSAWHARHVTLQPGQKPTEAEKLTNKLANRPVKRRSIFKQTTLEFDNRIGLHLL